MTLADKSRFIKLLRLLQMNSALVPHQTRDTRVELLPYGFTSGGWLHIRRLN